MTSSERNPHRLWQDGRDAGPIVRGFRPLLSPEQWARTHSRPCKVQVYSENNTDISFPVVVKPRYTSENGDWHVGQVAAEWLALRLARSVGVPVPGVFLVNMTDNVKQHIERLRDTQLMGGLHLGIEYIESAIALSNTTVDGFLPEPANLEEAKATIPLDMWVGNQDRLDKNQLIVFKRSSDSKTATTYYLAVDFGLAFFGDARNARLLADTADEFGIRLFRKNGAWLYSKVSRLGDFSVSVTTIESTDCQCECDSANESTGFLKVCSVNPQVVASWLHHRGHQLRQVLNGYDVSSFGGGDMVFFKEGLEVLTDG